MTDNTCSIGRGQQEWLGKRSQMVFPIELIDPRHEDKLGFARCLVWGFLFEGAICVALVGGWSLWLSVLVPAWSTR
jgi:hypothetical protein